MIGLEVSQGSELRTNVNSVFNLLSERQVFTSGSTCWSSPSPPSLPPSLSTAVFSIAVFPPCSPSLLHRRRHSRAVSRRAHS
uniref:Uncharacterized protein n=1 Tax=Hyaloperonospora arabidopsidis (strain Emoy2) TaxID=559515 RepID=M4BWN9_HYAAE